MEESLKRGKNDWLFVNRNYDKMDEQAISRIVNKYRDLVGTRTITPNVLRNAYLKSLDIENVEIEYLRKESGDTQNSYKRFKENIASANERYSDCLKKIAIIQACEEICNINLTEKKYAILISQGIPSRELKEIQSSKEFDALLRKIIETENVK